MVERLVANENVGGSNPLLRSKWPGRLVARTLPFQGREAGSKPVRATNTESLVMSKMIVAFMFILFGFIVGIDMFRKMTKSEKLGLTKLFAYSIVCSVAAMVVVTAIVLIF